MPRVLLEMSMSLDGYVAGPDVSPEAPMGRGGERLHADIARQYLEAGALEELRLHLVPVVLGAGTRLFDSATSLNVSLRPTAAINSPQATHLTYAVEHG